ncbi:MAG: endonuclease MutS2 [Candidatus Aquidulcis sp.]|nr:MAG: endonuclease MutS2 [Candidatus Aquidulcis sp.]
MSPAAGLPYDERSLTRLEWSALLGILSEACAFAPSRALAIDLRPTNGGGNQPTLRALGQEIAELRRDGGDPHIGGASDLEPAAERGAKGGTLDGSALFAVSETLRVVERLSSDLTGSGPTLSALAASLAPLRPLRSSIDRAISPDGSILDAASPLLGGLRALHRTSLERLRTRLETLAHAKDYSPYLQEPIVTVRNGRYVLPVRSEWKSRVPGIVHDASATGQTVWIEPLEVVELGNAVRESEAAVATEEARILGALSALVGADAGALRANGELLARFDLARAVADVARDRNWLYASDAPDGNLLLVEASHPLLTPPVVPMNLHLGPDQRVLVITGPNTGGKTVALKAVGLLTAMHHAGLPIPSAFGSAVPPTGNVWADIGDDQSIAQSLSTFSGHLTSIQRILLGAIAGDVVLLDEAGAGTDPAEGAALAAAIIDELRLRGCRVLATSHYAELKQYAHVTSGVVNGSVAFDLATLAPTYRLEVGAPGGSQAFAIAARLGLPQALLDAAQARRSDQGATLDAALAAAANAERDAREARQVAERLQERAAESLAQAVELRRSIERGAEEARQAATVEARDAAAAILLRVEQLRSALESGSLTPEILAVAANLQQVVASMTDPLLDEAHVSAGGATPSALVSAVGSDVVLRSGARGTLLSVDGTSATIALGRMHSSVPIAEISKILPAAKQTPHIARRASGPLTTTKLDLRGARVEDALVALELRISAVLLAGGEQLEIIHGVGTGALRDAVRRKLRELPEVREVRTSDEPGREGVTFALF